MSNRTALARTYRPRRFADVATQEHVSETLKTAVSRGRVAHAYLFCGPRGVGKTTAARILAMALNCPDRSDDGEPCGVCESCERIWSGKTSLDVVEIDAASNRGVDDARDLRERAMYAPTEEGRYKVYIIDEAHMLTREAWNALLKILEEPPPRVIFVFATTEPQKIQQAAPPILSRCQRFDFRRIGVTAIVRRLQAVLAQEGIEAREDALMPIARRADGGMRDALSLLDQVLSFAENELISEDVRRVLGLVDDELYLELFTLLADRRHADVFRFVERVLDEGYDLTEFYRGLADALRRTLVARLDGIDAADIREDLRDAYAEVLERFEAADLLRMLAQVSELDSEGRLRKSSNPRLLLETLLLRFSHQDRTIELEEVIRTLGGEATATVTATRGRGVGSGEGARARAGTSTPVSAPASAAPSGREMLREAMKGGGGAGAGAAPAVVPDVRAPATPAVEPAGVAVPAEASSAPPSERQVAQVLKKLAEKGGDLPPGVSIFLKVARVADVTAEHIVLELPEGPGLERLTTDSVAHAAIQRALNAGSSAPLALEVRAAPSGNPGGDPERLTPERLKADKLERLSRDEPVLGQAVAAWELELLD